MTRATKIITQDDVKYIASLSRVHLQKEETQHLTKDLEGILHYVHKLERLDVREIDPTSHVLPLKNVYRCDEVRSSLKQAEVMQLAIQQQNGFLKVPKVI